CFCTLEIRLKYFKNLTKLFFYVPIHKSSCYYFYYLIQGGKSSINSALSAFPFLIIYLSMQAYSSIINTSHVRSLHCNSADPYPPSHTQQNTNAFPLTHVMSALYEHPHTELLLSLQSSHLISARGIRRHTALLVLPRRDSAECSRE
ncbi:hypothetical protein XENOCAPTIV_023581, partial [Xenoophorus captivus]